VRDAFVKQLTALAAADPRIMLLTGDLGFRVLTEFAARFHKQYLNVGVAEQNLTGLATGLALEGRIVFTYSIGNFPTLRCLEQLRNDACYHNANVKVVSIGGGFSYGVLGISHHATEDLAILRALPDITVVAPCDHWEVAEATKALVAHQGTAFLRLDKSAAPPTVQPGETFRLGKARLVRRGNDVTLVATGGILGEGLRAAARLSEMGIECRVLSMPTIKPLDMESVAAAAVETGGIVSIEEHTVHGGLGGAIAESLLDEGIAPSCFLRIGLRAGFSSAVGSQQYLRKIYRLDAASIADAVSDRLRSSGSPRAVAASS